MVQICWSPPNLGLVGINKMNKHLLIFTQFIYFIYTCTFIPARPELLTMKPRPILNNYLVILSPTHPDMRSLYTSIPVPSLIFTEGNPEMILSLSPMLVAFKPSWNV